VNYIAILVAIPLCLAVGVAAPFIADGLDRRRQRAVTRSVKPS
jgi:hypothetical protein